MAEPWYCHYRTRGFINCNCARFDDGSCVPPWLYPEFARRRDTEGSARKFAKRESYSDSEGR